MKKICIHALIFVFLVPIIARGISEEQKNILAQAIDEAIDSVDPHIHIGIQVISLKHGDVLYQKNPHIKFIPASNTKLFTSAAALALLGPSYRFETQLFITGKVKNGILYGDVYLKGAGDPTLTSDDLKVMAKQLSLYGITLIKGAVYCDITEFDKMVRGPGWSWDMGPTFSNAPLDSLMINHSCIDCYVLPTQPGKKPQVRLKPHMGDFVINNTALTVGNLADPLVVSRQWLRQKNSIDIVGSISHTASPAIHKMAVEMPYEYTCAVFKQLLNSYGIVTPHHQVMCKVVPSDASVIYTHYSPTISSMIRPILKKSDNLYADALFKKMGVCKKGSPGTWHKGKLVLTDFLSNKVGLDPKTFWFVDGSGMSRYNLVSPSHLVKLLQWIYEHPSNNKKQGSLYKIICEGLPVAGVDGALKHRMKDKTVRTRVRAKTGFLGGVVSLSGYIVTVDGDVLAFAIMINGFIGSPDVYKKLEDRIATLLSTFKRNETLGSGNNADTKASVELVEQEVYEDGVDEAEEELVCEA